MDVFSQTTFSNAFSLMKMLKFRLNFHWSLVPKVRINNIPALVQIMAWRRPGDKPLSEQMMVSLLTHMRHSASMSQMPCVVQMHIKCNIKCQNTILWPFGVFVWNGMHSCASSHTLLWYCLLECTGKFSVCGQWHMSEWSQRYKFCVFSQISWNKISDGIEDTNSLI